MIESRRAQVTIFIILGIMLVAIFLAFFLFRGSVVPTPGGGKQQENPIGFLESCIEPKINEAVSVLLKQGGHIENDLAINFKFNNEEAINISYLCYNQNYYFPCINQEPMLLQHLKDEIYNHIKDDIENCLEDLESSFSKRNDEVVIDYNDFEVVLLPKKVLVNLDARITISKSGETTTRDDIEFVVPTRFYDLATVVQEIVSQEARFCNFEVQGFVLFYPEYDIDRIVTGKGDILYRVKHKDTGETYNFAIRGCVIPPGF